LILFFNDVILFWVSFDVPFFLLLFGCAFCVFFLAHF